MSHLFHASHDQEETDANMVRASDRCSKHAYVVVNNNFFEGMVALPSSNVQIARFA